MKGLLIKDLRLLKGQRILFAIILIIAMIMAFAFENPSFIVSYMTIIGVTFMVSTISYDELDHGFTFLFTMPISKKEYVLEKYVFALILGSVFWILATAFSVLSGKISGSVSIEEVLKTAIGIFPIMVIMLSVMIPFRLKFGGDKGRIAIMGALGVIVLLVLGAIKIIELLDIDLNRQLNYLLTMESIGIIAIVAGITLAVLLISIKTSIAVMRKKEF